MATLTGNGGSVSGNAFLETELSISNGTGSQGTICSGSFSCTSTPLDLSVTTNVPVDLLTITVFAQVLAETGAGGTVNIDPSINLILPAGVTATLETATPLPAALPLFATGLGGLGLLGWRMKRKLSTEIV
jgi:hypothetical protein